MKLILFTCGVCLLGSNVFAKCMYSGKIPLTLCSEVRIEKVIQPGECVFEAKLLKFDLFRAEIQGLDELKTLKKKESFSLKLDQKSCKDIRPGKVINAIISAYCDDKGENLKYDFTGSSAEKSETFVVEGNKVVISCK